MNTFMSRMCGKLLGLAGVLLLLLMATGVVHAGTVTYVYTDPQGTPLAEADASGNITATFDYAPYGSIALGTAPNGPGYTGHVNDPDTGLVYMQARYYDPGVGRFISTDPVGSSTGNAFNFNRYAYANNNPIDNMDADGRQTGSLINPDSEGIAGPGYTTVVNPNSSEGGGKQAKQRPALIPLSSDVNYKVATPKPNDPEVHPVFSPKTADNLDAAFTELNKDGIVPEINSAFRTPDEQAYMQAGGSGSNPAAKVSWHEAGAALDINGTRNPQFQKIISVMKKNGFVWGGNFKGKKQQDPPHFDGRGFSGNQSQAISKAQAYWDSNH